MIFQCKRDSRQESLLFFLYHLKILKSIFDSLSRINLIQINLYLNIIIRLLLGQKNNSLDMCSNVQTKVTKKKNEQPAHCNMIRGKNPFPKNSFLCSSISQNLDIIRCENIKTFGWAAYPSYQIPLRERRVPFLLVKCSYIRDISRSRVVLTSLPDLM